MYYKIFIAVMLAALILLSLWLLRGRLLTPVRLGKNQRLSLVLTVSGPAEELENTVESLLWLIDNGTLRGEILVRDAGMDPETAAAAELLQRRGAIKIIY
ncbi:MAG: hypothetical protein ACI4PC_09735 [Oscillospiraceae bacterium]